MQRKSLNPKALFEPRFFTHTVAVSGPMTLVYVSGQVSYDAKGGVVGKGDMRAQTAQVFESLAHNLKAAGATWRDVVKVNGYMVGLNAARLAAYREERARFLDARQLPASTLVGVDALVHPDLLLEVEVVAAIGRRKAAPKPPARRR